MDLETFIAETLRQIVKGVQMAQRCEDCQDAKIVPNSIENKRAGTTTFLEERIEQIAFDVAVTVTEGSEKKGGIGVFTGAFGIGGQANANTANNSVSRIKFSVPVVLPTKR
jgi:hypothetical protein